MRDRHFRQRTATHHQWWNRTGAGCRAIEEHQSGAVFRCHAIVTQHLHRQAVEIPRRLRPGGAQCHQIPHARDLWIHLETDTDAPGPLRAQLEEAATRLAPEFAEFLTRHVRNTVREWDGREMADQIELNIGKDLQAIRVNGTIVGGVIGLGLHLLTYAAGGT